MLSLCGFIVVKAIVIKVMVIPGVLLQSPLKSAIMAPLNLGSLFPLWSGTDQTWSCKALQKHLCVLSLLSRHSQTPAQPTFTKFS